MIISVHVPKCAGTSFRHVLAELYGDALWLNYGAIFSREQFRADVVPAQATCIHGHFFADAFDSFVSAESSKLVTWVRHPVDRVVSHYYHFLRSPDMRDDCCCALYERGLKLIEFAELDWMRNEATRYLAGKSIEQFAFVGVAERFEESLSVFADDLGWPLSLEVPRVNTNPDRKTASYELSADDYEQIINLNTLDLMWYRRAVERLERQLMTRAPLVA
ncbi:MAG: sulfotransferase family 2 domain-containing protein [Undibacterium sp.]|nr:sulfotransferase family 2 domain-containing protein [Opitutaceae bacterium]